MQITKKIAQKVLETVDQGLVHGLGKAVPGQMCVEAAVCYALGLPHGDDPSCVSQSLRQLKIGLNDSNWSSNKARAKGLRRLALAQLGSINILNELEFGLKVSKYVIQVIVPISLRAVATVNKDYRNELETAAVRCEKEGTARAASGAARAASGAASGAASEAARAASEAARAASWAASGAASWAARAARAASDKLLSDFAEGVVQILIEMKAPGCKWLYLTD